MSDCSISSLPSPFERFCLVLSQIPKGKVCSYGRVAELASLGNARQTCRWLRELPIDSELPWYRIVSVKGKLAVFSNSNKQKKTLEREGVIFTSSERIPKQYYI
jgi:methylated-DNA-protein-cysteine methyltransferase-like protein